MNIIIEETWLTWGIKDEANKKQSEDNRKGQKYYESKLKIDEQQLQRVKSLYHGQ